MSQTESQKMECSLSQIVPTIPGNGSRILIRNALLDEGSTQTYLNADITAKLGLNVEIGKIQDSSNLWNSHYKV